MICQITITKLEELQKFVDFVKANKDVEFEFGYKPIIKTEKVEAPKAEPKAEEKKAEEPESDPAEVFDEPKTETPAIAFEDLRAELTQIARAGHNDGIQKIIKSKGASKLSEIDPSLYGEVLAEARALTA